MDTTLELSKMAMDGYEEVVLRKSPKDFYSRFRHSWTVKKADYIRGILVTQWGGQQKRLELECGRIELGAPMRKALTAPDLECWFTASERFAYHDNLIKLSDTVKDKWAWALGHGLQVKKMEINMRKDMMVMQPRVK